jgi:hypothetical protein
LLVIVRQSAPFPWRHPHPFGKHTPECRNRLVPDFLGHSLGADRWLFQLVGRQTHAQIGQQERRKRTLRLYSDGFHTVLLIVGARLAHMSGGLSHRRALIVIDYEPPESVRTAAHDIACRASEVHVLAVGPCAIN